MLRRGLWLCVLLGCEGAPPANPGRLVALEDYPVALAEAVCASIDRCPLMAADALLSANLGSGADCVRRMTDYFRLQAEDLTGIVRTGAARFDNAGLGRCVERIRARCLLGRDLVDNPCPEAFVGTVPVGGMCWRTEDCTAEGWCSNGTTAQRRCPGVCAPRAPRGGACTEMTPCPADQACDPPNAVTGRCVDVHVDHDAPDGMTCGNVAWPDGSRHVVQCATGLFCTSRHGQGRCFALLAEGAPCTGSATCAPGLLCVGTPLACRAVPVHTEVGDPCDPMGVTAQCNTLERLQCVGGRCVRLGDGTEGTACSGGDLGWRACAPGLYCERTTATCRAVLPMGSTCRADNDCASGECADFEPRTCLERMCR